MMQRGQLGKAFLFVAVLPALASAAPQEERQIHVAPKVFAWRGMDGGYLGVQVLDLTPELRRHFGVAEDTGVLVSRVEDGSPAEAAGILVGDILTSIDGEAVSNLRQLRRSMRDKEEGETVSVELRRGGSSLRLPVSVEERDRSVVDLAEFHFIAGPGPMLDEEAVRVFEDSMRDIEKHFESAEWQDRLKRIQELDLTKVQERMREVEERLEKLERELENELDTKSRKKQDP